jgi:hypothetical protein
MAGLLCLEVLALEQLARVGFAAVGQRPPSPRAKQFCNRCCYAPLLLRCGAVLLLEPAPGTLIAVVCAYMRTRGTKGATRTNTKPQLLLAADRLVMEGLLSEALALLRAARPRAASDAAALLRLAFQLPGRSELRALGDAAERLVSERLSPAGAGDAMALAVAFERPALRVGGAGAFPRPSHLASWFAVGGGPARRSQHLPLHAPAARGPLPPALTVQARCEALMLAHRSADVWGVLRFALRFRLPRLQRACVEWLGSVTKCRLLWHADTVVAVAEQHVRAQEQQREAGQQPQSQQPQPQGQQWEAPDVASAARQLPVIACLEAELAAEQQAAGPKALAGYVAASERLRLGQLREALLRHAAAAWRGLSSAQPQVARGLREAHPAFASEAAARAGAADGGGAAGTRAPAVWDDVDALLG